MGKIGMILAATLEWKYGCVAGTIQVDPTDMSSDPEMKITYWRHQTISKPSKSQLLQDIVEYREYLALEEEKRIGREAAELAFVEANKNKTASELTAEDIEQYRRIQIAKECNLVME